MSLSPTSPLTLLAATAPLDDPTCTSDSTDEHSILPRAPSTETSPETDAAVTNPVPPMTDTSPDTDCTLISDWLPLTSMSVLTPDSSSDIHLGTVSR